MRYKSLLRYRPFLIVSAVVFMVVGLVSLSARKAKIPHLSKHRSHESEMHSTINEVNHFFTAEWKKEKVPVSKNTDELSILRRLSLSLHGTIPSLEEIRIFEADTEEDRLERWLDKMLNDNRFGDYFSERFSRFIVGVEEGPFLIYRRDRFKSWLAAQFQKNRSYQELTRELISSYGLATTHPGTNFVYATIEDEDINESRLSGRIVRAFLGQRIDCAQCHDHPFAKWKQSEFEGIAAHFGQLSITPYGLEDKQEIDGESLEYKIEVPDKAPRIVKPSVPFNPEWIPAEGTRRHKLAMWVTHSKNRRFERAIANRVWGLMFGKAYYTPVDDLPDPDPESPPDLLDILGKDFRENGYQIKRLIKIIANSKPFLISATHSCEAEEELIQAEEAWAVFPLTRLRPEQAVGAMLQSASLKTIDQNSHLIVRIIRATNENDFIKDYGDLGEDELIEQAVTISQTLLRLNSRFSADLSKADLFRSAGRIAGFSSDDKECVECCFLVCLSRKPTTDELNHFVKLLKDTAGDKRGRVVQDIYWSMFNSPEFSLNH